MNKAGVWFNIVATIVGIAAAFSILPTFHDWAGWLLAVVVAGNVIIHTWFPGKPQVDVPTPPSAPVLGQ